MTATISINEYNGAGPTETIGVTNCNFGTSDSANIVTATYPIVAGFHSYEKYWKMFFTGTFNKVDNLKFYKSAGTIDANADVLTNATGASYTAISYATPVTGTSSKATKAIAESEPAGANIGIGGALAGSITVTSGFSDYIGCQYQTTASHTPGDIASLTLKFQYDEQ